MTGALVFAGTLLALFAAAVWLTNMAGKAQQTKKTMGELMNEEKANENLRKRNEVLESTPVDGAAERVRNKWTRP